VGSPDLRSSQAVTSRKGGGITASVGKKFGMVSAKLQLSTDRESQENWHRELILCGVGDNIEEAQRIEEEHRLEAEAEARQVKEQLERQESAAAGE
jgi:hypothetical protein